MEKKLVSSYRNIGHRTCFFLVISFVSLCFTNAHASDIAEALKLAKKVLGNQATEKYKEFVNSKPDEALAIILASGSLPDGSTKKYKRANRTPAFTTLGKVRLAYPALRPIIEEASRKSGLPPALEQARLLYP